MNGVRCINNHPRCGRKNAMNTPQTQFSASLGRATARVVCLCGSSRWPELHHRVMMEETLAGNIVLPLGLYSHADFPPGAKAATNDGDEATAVKQMLDRLHYQKIDLAEEIIVVSKDGYFGSSTQREIAYAQAQGKRVRYWQNASTNDDLSSLDKRNLKGRIFGTFSPPTPSPSQASPAEAPASDSTRQPDEATTEVATSGGGSILICKKCGCLLPVCESRIDMLVQHAGLEQRPEGRFYFTSEICFECSEQAAIFVPPVTLVRVADAQAPDKI
jgi:hypothetical protein